MNLKYLFVAVPALLILGNGVANAAETINDAGALACINDKWDEKEVDKGHKLVDYAAPGLRSSRRDGFLLPTMRPSFPPQQSQPSLSSARNGLAL